MTSCSDSKAIADEVHMSGNVPKATGNNSPRHSSTATMGSLHSMTSASTVSTTNLSCKLTCDEQLSCYSNTSCMCVTGTSTSAGEPSEVPTKHSNNNEVACSSEGILPEAAQIPLSSHRNATAGTSPSPTVEASLSGMQSSEEQKSITQK